MIRRDSIILQTGAAAALIGAELVTFVQFMGESCWSIWDAVRHPRKIRRKETLYYMNVCGADGLPITMLICFLSFAGQPVSSRHAPTKERTSFSTSVFALTVISLETGMAPIVFVCFPT